MTKVVLGFSGGVDSAVSAELLKKQGFQVLGLYLDNAGEEARQAAEYAAEQRGIELRVLDVHTLLEKQVCRPFAAAYLRGETPNPCIICNPSVKFKSLLDCADEAGAELISTGHYARSDGGKVFKGRPSNDQSYMLCRLTPEQAGRLILPLGSYEKLRCAPLRRNCASPLPTSRTVWRSALYLTKTMWVGCPAAAHYRQKETLYFMVRLLDVMRAYTATPWASAAAVLLTDARCTSPV